MRNPKVAHRYAKSLLDLASERNQQDDVRNDMELILDTIRESRDLSVLLHSPVVKADKKEKILEALFGQHVSELSIGFLRIMSSKGREALLEEIAKNYIQQIKYRKGIMTAQVTTATNADEATRTQILSQLKKLNPDGEIEITENVDPELIGGFVIKVEDKMIDASVRSQLRKLRREFTDNSYEAAL